MMSHDHHYSVEDSTGQSVEEEEEEEEEREQSSEVTTEPTVAVSSYILNIRPLLVPLPLLYLPPM